MLSCPCIVFRHSPVLTSQNFTVLSALPEARILPEGLNATDQTQLACPVQVLKTSPVVLSHNFTVLSALAEARILLEGLNATLNTQPLVFGTSLETLSLF
jgi:hypothetical protein